MSLRHLLDVFKTSYVWILDFVLSGLCESISFYMKIKETKIERKREKERERDYVYYRFK